MYFINIYYKYIIIYYLYENKLCITKYNNKKYKI